MSLYSLSTGYIIGFLIGRFLISALIGGLIPFIICCVKQRWGLGIGALVTCGLLGAIFGGWVSLVVGVVFLVISIVAAGISGNSPQGVTKEDYDRAAGWLCPCGRRNSSFSRKCSCGMSKPDAPVPTSRTTSATPGQWLCSCGRSHPAYVSSCVCGKSKQDATKASPAVKPLLSSHPSAAPAVQNLASSPIKDHFEQLQSNYRSAAESAKPQLLAELGQAMLELPALWVAYDDNCAGRFPYISLIGQMQIFTEEAYGQAARNHFRNTCEGNFSLKRISKEEYATKFDEFLMLGATSFQLNNGQIQAALQIETFFPYQDSQQLDRYNRAIRCYMFRHLQSLTHYQKISDPQVRERQKSMYEVCLNTLLSNGLTALANGTVYTLTYGAQLEHTSFYTKAAYERVKANLAHGDEALMIAPGDTSVSVVDAMTGTETCQNSRGRFVPIFTTKAAAEDMRAAFGKINPAAPYRVVAANVDELITYGLSVDGFALDPNSYGYLISRDIIQSMQRQMHARA